MTVFETSIGRIAILICYDIEFPELSRILVDAGVDLIIVPFATDERKAYSRVRYCAHARAIENTAYVLGVPMRGRGVTGNPALVGPTGTVLDEAVWPGPRSVVAEVDREVLVAVRVANPSLDNRRYRVVPRE